MRIAKLDSTKNTTKFTQNNLKIADEAIRIRYDKFKDGNEIFANGCGLHYKNKNVFKHFLTKVRIFFTDRKYNENLFIIKDGQK